MGKEWLHWVLIGGRGRKSSGKKGRNLGEMDNEVASSGCICAVFQMFDLHHHQRPDFHFSSRKGGNSARGKEAPRNSLELCNYSTAIKQETNLDFDNVGTEIRTTVLLSLPRVTTSRSKSGSNNFSSCLESPGSKTPTVVARLMGLDLLPECNSESHSNLNSHLQTNCHIKDMDFLHGRSSRSFYDKDISSGSRSLPESPRVSSARRSDVQRHRLSLEMNKENLNDELDRGTRSRRFHPSRHFDKQFQDRSVRRVGVDITNTNRAMEKTRRDENLVPLKTRSKSSKKLPGEVCHGSLDKPITTSNSRTLRQRNQTIIPPQERQQKRAKEGKSPRKCSSSGLKKSPRQSSENAISNKKQEKFVNSTGKKSKKTPLPIDILTKLPPAPIQALSSKRSNPLSRNPSHPYNPQNNGCPAAEYGNYVQTILERSGIAQNAPRFGLSGPIDPSIFHYLEFFFVFSDGTKLSHRCNRKLIFDLVGELLGEISGPRFDMRFKLFRPAPDAHLSLVEKMVKKIERLSAKNCATIDEVDCLIDEDLRKSVFEEELESTVCEIEGEILELLVRETAGMAVPRRGGGKTEMDVK